MPWAWPFGTSGGAGLPLWTTCDVFAPGIALGHVVGRFGCFFAGCCYGRPTTKPWGIVFRRSVCRGQCGNAARRAPAPHAAVQGRCRLIILGILLLAERRSQRFAGFTFWIYILLYAISRYIIEIFRGDERGAIGMFSTSQFISLVLAPLADCDAHLPRAPKGTGAEERAKTSR